MDVRLSVAVEFPESDEFYMHRAIALAMEGRGLVEPNPMVGCVIVKQGRVIGEGYHERFGGPHAEPNALANCSESAAGATAYVTLEPCCHADKKTPPCVPALVDAKLARVVVGCADPNPKVGGRGIEQLRAAGIEVTAPVLETQTKQLNAAYSKRTLHHLPYVTLKWAQSADGKVAGPKGQRVWITNDVSTQLVHALRAASDAILVGINTALADDPMLTARGVEAPRPLIRAIADSDLRLPPASRLVKTAAEHSTVVYCDNAHADSAAAMELREHGVRVVGLASCDGKLDLPQLLVDLGTKGVTHLMVEPGPILAASFLEQNLADRVWVFQSSRRIEGETSLLAPAVTYPAVASVPLDGDKLTEYFNPSSAVFFSSAPSADFPREV